MSQRNDSRNYAAHNRPRPILVPAYGMPTHPDYARANAGPPAIPHPSLVLPGWSAPPAPTTLAAQPAHAHVHVLRAPRTLAQTPPPAPTSFWDQSYGPLTGRDWTIGAVSLLAGGIFGALLAHGD